MKEKFRRIASILPALCLSLFVSAPSLFAANGNENSSTRAFSKIERNVGDFKGLVSSGSIPVTYIQSNISKIVIEGDPQFFDALKTEVNAEQLHIGMKKGTYRNLNLAVTVYSPVLDDITIAGSGSFFDLEGHSSSDDIHYHSAGSGKGEFGGIICHSFDCSLSGSGRISIDQIDCDNASLSSSGSGGITVKSLNASNDVSLRLAGSGFGLLDNIDINGNLSLTTSGSGSIKVNGSADTVKASTSGSGSIIGSLEHEKLDTRTSGSGRIRL